MSRVRQCLIISLAIHILAAILAGRSVMSPLMRHRIRPFAESRHSDELLVEMLESKSLKRSMMVHETVTPSQVAEIQTQSLELANLSPAKVGYKITPVMPEETMFLPAIADSMLHESVPEPTYLFPETEIVAYGAGKHIRAVYIDAGYCVILYIDDLQEMTRSFLLAMIERDYEKAHEIAGPKYPADRLKRSRYADITEIVSISKPALLRSVAMSANVAVPCEMNLMSNGIIEGDIVIVMPYYAARHGWFIDDIISR